MVLRHFRCWLFGGKEKDGNKNPSFNSAHDAGFGVRESDSVKFPYVKGERIGSSSSSASPRRRIKKKWQTREERRTDREYDMVVVPSADGVSGSESDDSDWSIGWLEPHGSDFLSDDETDDSFAVLVPCYKSDQRGAMAGANNQLLTAIQIITNEHFTGKNGMEQLLTSLRNAEASIQGLADQREGFMDVDKGNRSRGS